MYTEILHFLSFFSMVVFSWSAFTILASQLQGRIKHFLTKIINITFVMLFFLFLTDLMGGNMSSMTASKEKALKILASGFIPMAIMALLILFKVKKEESEK